MWPIQPTKIGKNLKKLGAMENKPLKFFLEKMLLMFMNAPSKIHRGAFGKLLKGGSNTAYQSAKNMQMTNIWAFLNEDLFLTNTNKATSFIWIVPLFKLAVRAERLETQITGPLILWWFVQI